jgi:hypothetical protein
MPHREPASHSFETSLPGVFAAGDVRYGSVKRVAGAAGRGRWPSGPFFNPALRGMDVDVRREPVAEPADAQAAGQDGQTMIASPTTDIH